MKKSANWMVSEDDRILEYLDREGASSWWEVAHDLHLQQRLVRTWLRVLVKAGWITSHDRGDLDDHWSITTWGAGYLDGHVNADLVRPLPALRPSYATRPEEWAGF
jgi:DNA-binding IclR family transcriptional regulator